MKKFCDEFNNIKTRKECVEKIGFIHNQHQRIHGFIDYISNKLPFGDTVSGYVTSISKSVVPMNKYLVIGKTAIGAVIVTVGLVLMVISLTMGVQATLAYMIPAFICLLVGSFIAAPYVFVPMQGIGSKVEPETTDVDTSKPAVKTYVQNLYHGLKLADMSVEKADIEKLLVGLTDEDFAKGVVWAEFKFKDKDGRKKAEKASEEITKLTEGISLLDSLEKSFGEITKPEDVKSTSAKYKTVKTQIDTFNGKKITDVDLKVDELFGKIEVKEGKAKVEKTTALEETSSLFGSKDLDVNNFVISILNRMAVPAITEVEIPGADDTYGKKPIIDSKRLSEASTAVDQSKIKMTELARQQITERKIVNASELSTTEQAIKDLETLLRKQRPSSADSAKYDNALRIIAETQAAIRSIRENNAKVVPVLVKAYEPNAPVQATDAAIKVLNAAKTPSTTAVVDTEVQMLENAKKPAVQNEPLATKITDLSNQIKVVAQQLEEKKQVVVTPEEVTTAMENKKPKPQDRVVLQKHLKTLEAQLQTVKRTPAEQKASEAKKKAAAIINDNAALRAAVLEGALYKTPKTVDISDFTSSVDRAGTASELKTLYSQVGIMVKRIKSPSAATSAENYAEEVAKALFMTIAVQSRLNVLDPGRKNSKSFRNDLQSNGLYLLKLYQVWAVQPSISVKEVRESKYSPVVTVIKIGLRVVTTALTLSALLVGLFVSNGAVVAVFFMISLIALAVQGMASLPVQWSRLIGYYRNWSDMKHDAPYIIRDLSAYVLALAGLIATVVLLSIFASPITAGIVLASALVGGTIFQALAKFTKKGETQRGIGSSFTILGAFETVVLGMLIPGVLVFLGLYVSMPIFFAALIVYAGLIAGVMLYKYFAKGQAKIFVAITIAVCTFSAALCMLSAFIFGLPLWATIYLVMAGVIIFASGLLISIFKTTGLYKNKRKLVIATVAAIVIGSIFAFGLVGCLFIPFPGGAVIDAGTQSFTAFEAIMFNFKDTMLFEGMTGGSGFDIGSWANWSLEFTKMDASGLSALFTNSWKLMPTYLAASFTASVVGLFVSLASSVTKGKEIRQLEDAVKVSLAEGKDPSSIDTAKYSEAITRSVSIKVITTAIFFVLVLTASVVFVALFAAGAFTGSWGMAIIPIAGICIGAGIAGYGAFSLLSVLRSPMNTISRLAGSNQRNSVIGLEVASAVLKIVIGALFAGIVVVGFFALKPALLGLLMFLAIFSVILYALVFAVQMYMIFKLNTKSLEEARKKAQIKQLEKLGLLENGRLQGTRKVRDEELPELAGLMSNYLRANPVSANASTFEKGSLPEVIVGIVQKSDKLEEFVEAYVEIAGLFTEELYKYAGVMRANPDKGIVLDRKLDMAEIVLRTAEASEALLVSDKADTLILNLETAKDNLKGKEVYEYSKPEEKALQAAVEDILVKTNSQVKVDYPNVDNAIATLSKDAERASDLELSAVCYLSIALLYALDGKKVKVFDALRNIENDEILRAISTGAERQAGLFLVYAIAAEQAKGVFKTADENNAVMFYKNLTDVEKKGLAGFVNKLSFNKRLIARKAVVKPVVKPVVPQEPVPVPAQPIVEPTPVPVLVSEKYKTEYGFLPEGDLKTTVGKLLVDKLIDEQKILLGLLKAGLSVGQCNLIAKAVVLAAEKAVADKGAFVEAVKTKLDSKVKAMVDVMFASDRIGAIGISDITNQSYERLYILPNAEGKVNGVDFNALLTGLKGRITELTDAEKAVVNQIGQFKVDTDEDTALRLEVALKLLLILGNVKGKDKAGEVETAITALELSKYTKAALGD
ncbi:hypothetical protein KKC59_04280, partial [bacterium]|nr:hypothetical protein [bacterium]